jgi:HEPN domain-containing protein
LAIPSSRDARLFYRAAYQRREDAQYLLENDRTTAAIYLAGYSVECIFKSLIVATVSDGERPGVIASFRGRVAHDFDWLRRAYLERSGASIPLVVARNLTRVNSWTTDLRYNPGTSKRSEAEAFLLAADNVIQWADGRL